jgi:hypothetical protein
MARRAIHTVSIVFDSPISNDGNHVVASLNDDRRSLTKLLLAWMAQRMLPLLGRTLAQAHKGSSYLRWGLTQLHRPIAHGAPSQRVEDQVEVISHLLSHVPGGVKAVSLDERPQTAGTIKTVEDLSVDRIALRSLKSRQFLRSVAGIVTRDRP